MILARRKQQTARRRTKKAIKNIQSELQSKSVYEDSDSNNFVPHLIENNVKTITVPVEYDSEPHSDTQSVSSTKSYEVNIDYHSEWEVIENLFEETAEESESDGDDKKEEELVKDLAKWQTTAAISKKSFTKLLKLLRKHGHDIPADANTVLKTPRSGTIQVIEKSGGLYTYFGIKKGLDEIFSKKQELMESVNTLDLSFNIDGLPIFKSKNISVWPIQCTVANVCSIIAHCPFIVALYSGSGKPVNNDFLTDYIQELNFLTENGYNGKEVKIYNVICDAPARAMIKGIVQFNGYYGCDMCDIRGEYIERRMLFLEKGNTRTDETFRIKKQPGHHKSTSPFLQLKDVDMINQFPIDPMHCVDLGVTKRLLILWKEGPLPQRLSAGMIAQISNYLTCLKPFMPSVFNRKPRGLDELRMWKATEFRTFLMYTGPVVLKYILPNRQYEHFLALSVAVCILYNKTLLISHKNYAASLLSCFIEESRHLYTDKFVSYNVHCLFHLTDVATYFKSLENCSAYKFENHMSQIKRMVRGSGDPIIQIANRLAEKSQHGLDRQTEDSLPFIKKMGCYKLKSGKFCTIHDIQKNRILCEIYTKTEAFYSKPCDSRIIGIHKTDGRNSKMLWKENSDILCSAMSFPLSVFGIDYPTSKVLLPLMHTVDL